MPNNRTLHKIFRADQSDRTAHGNFTTDVLRCNDVKRLKRVEKLLARGALKTASDYYHAAMIFQHAPTISHSRIAKHLSHAAMRLGDERAKSLYAACTDRLLTKLNKRQKFGTQYIQVIKPKPENKVERRWILFPLNRTITDAERAKYNVPPLNELRRRARAMSG